MIPATVTVDIRPDRAELVMQLINRGIESRLPLTAEERTYAVELSLCLELLAGMHRPDAQLNPSPRSAIY